MKLNLACGENRLEGWENHDADVDLTKLPLPWEAGTVDCVLLEHFAEHLTSREAYYLFEDLHRILKPGGVLRVCVPNILKSRRLQTPEYIKFYMDRWGHRPIKSLCVDHGHKMLWTEELLETVLLSAGFSSVKEAFNSENRMGFCDGHWKIIGIENNCIETIAVEATK